jgi:hypothetical protein
LTISHLGDLLQSHTAIMQRLRKCVSSKPGRRGAIDAPVRDLR